MTKTYIISQEMLECFKNSLKLNRQYADEKIFIASKWHEKDKAKTVVEHHKSAIKNIDIVLDELEKIEKSSK